MAKKIEWFEILFWIFLIILIIMILSRIFGKSATDINIILTIAAIMLAIMGHIVKMNREIGEIKVGIKYSFNNIKNDMNSIKKGLNLIKKKLKV